MSLELLSKLETKIQAALETIELQKMELEEEKQKSAEMTQQAEQLQAQNQHLQLELNSWNEKVTGLVGLLNNQVD
ncbi:MAG: cell division protein ZapB [Shewanella sp.]|uniref:cell division protein ZapB n=1 Tax=Shewanella sp. SNU WT4 TaxID=2590015 RepID=UPI00112BC9FA|nr:cell division protein ZapB [Shewanella sp. SNU WT4]QDF65834.1 cell division protein ZapB [Shewanella sp. SNU WT4]